MALQRRCNMGLGQGFREVLSCYYDWLAVLVIQFHGFVGGMTEQVGGFLRYVVGGYGGRVVGVHR